jgi:aryl-alcohol dehydrogenase-like predicted oxidoreductase
MPAMTGLQSRIGLGTAPLGSRVDGPLWWGPQDPADAVAAVRAALDAGVDWIDTAPFYGWGRAEELVGQAIAGRRDEVRILTKCGTVRRPDGQVAEDASPGAIRAGLRESLRRLGTDHVDVLQVHDPDPATPVEQTWAAIAELVAEGLVRAGGLSNHPVELMERAHAVAPVPVVQHQYSLLHRAPETDGVLAWCAEHDSTFLAWSPLASGFLVDGFDLAALVPGDLRHRLPWASQDLTGPLGRLAAVATRRGVPAHRVALAWATRRPGTYAIVGARTPAEAADLLPLPTLSPADVAALDPTPTRPPRRQEGA